MDVRMDGRVAVITGASTGLGLAMAKEFAASGGSVALLARKADVLATAKAEVQKAAGKSNGRFEAYSCDVSKAAPIADTWKKIQADFGKVDIVVNNAGIQHVAPIEEFPVEKWDAIIAINLSAAFHTIRTAVPGMKTRKWGRIINTASAHSLVASPFKSAYVTAKHGLAGLTKTVALELATFGVTANCISPGYVWTPLVEKQIPDTMKARNMTAEQVKRDVLLAAQPTKEFVTVDQVASLALYLCSDAASQITGANLSIDGGWTAE
jgi:3-hydroxybutyrate dehydrogenase